MRLVAGRLFDDSSAGGLLVLVESSWIDDLSVTSISMALSSVLYLFNSKE